MLAFTQESGGHLGSPEQEAVGEIKETHLMPATARFCGVTQQDGVEVGIHGIRERLEVSVEESSAAGNEGVRVQPPKGNIHTQAPPSSNLRVPELQLLVSNGSPWKTGLNKTIPSSTVTTIALYCAKHNYCISSFDNPRNNSYYYDTHFTGRGTQGHRGK